MGYRQVYVLTEGIPGWERAGYAVQAAAEHLKTVRMPKLSSQELKRLLDAQPTDVLLVDVRERDEYERGHLPGAVNLPLTRFEQEAGRLDRGKPIILYCATGARNYNAYRILTRLGHTGLRQAVYGEWEAAGMPVER